MEADRRSRLIEVAPADFRLLSPDERERFLVHGERLTRHALWEGARGVEVTDEMIFTVAAHAALLTAGFDERAEPYLNVRSIVLHSGTIVTNDTRPGPATGVMTSVSVAEQTPDTQPALELVLVNPGAGATLATLLTAVCACAHCEVSMRAAKSNPEQRSNPLSRKARI